MLVRIVLPDDAEFRTGRHLWSGLFGLTAREADVTEALLEGLTLECVAERLQMSRNTARVHLQSVFRKTNTARQAELIRLLADLTRV